MMKARKRDLIGRRIVAVDWRPFQAAPETFPRLMAHFPRLMLDNGRELYFVTEETEVGEYGTRVCITEKGKKD